MHDHGLADDAVRPAELERRAVEADVGGAVGVGHQLGHVAHVVLAATVRAVWLAGGVEVAAGAVEVG